MSDEYRRALYFVHFNKHEGLADYVVHWLEALAPLFARIVFISNSVLSEADRMRINGHVSAIVQRENHGFDFAGWRDALQADGWDVLTEFDSITLMNDSCFGPIHPLDAVYQNMEAEGVDFWGISNHRKTHEGMPGTNGPVPESIQSYFMVFEKAVIESPAFRLFWEKVDDIDEVDLVIQRYETQLTRILEGAGFTYGVLIDTRTREDTSPDWTIYHPDVILPRSPMLKVKAFGETPHQGNFSRYALKYLASHTDYPSALIVDHLESIYQPDRNIFFGDKLIGQSVGVTAQATIAIHIHAFYPEELQKYLKAFGGLPFECDFFLTADTPEKIQTALSVAEKQGMADRIKKTLLVPNKGRDIVPWLMVAKHMEAYDLCAHLHTKKTIQKDGSTYLGEAWQNELIESLIVSAPDIVNEMTIHEGLGVVIPDIPETFQREEGTVYDREDEIRSHCALLWERMGTTKKLDFDSQPVYVMPYGTMFWYKPKAMTKLTSLHLAIDDIPPEPLREHGTILHAIERLIVYVAWDAGYSYKVVPNQRYVAAFFSNISYNRYFFDRVGTGTKRLDGIRYPELIRYVIKRTGRLLRRLIASPFKGKEKP